VVDNRSFLVQSTEPKPTKYIVEQTKQSPCVDLTDPTIQEIYVAYSARAIICRFNGFYPKYEQLHQWIYQTWYTEFEISLCAKGFFIVYFENPADYK
jgi:hypothetical protein